MKDEQNDFIANVFNTNSLTQGCTQAFQGAFTTLMNAYEKLQEYFMNQYIGNDNVLLSAFRDSCADNQCKTALDTLLGMLTGAGSGCDLI